MNVPDAKFWLGTARTVGVEVFLVAALACAVQRPLRHAGWRRAVWQITVICLLVLPLCEWTGMGRGVATFLFGQHGAILKTTAESGQPAVAESTPGLSIVLAPPEETVRAMWWPSWLWLGGAAVVVCRIVAAQTLLLALRLRQGRIQTGPLREQADEIGRRIGLRQTVRLLWTPDFVSPMAFGTVRPCIGLPPRFLERFNKSERDAILAHELAHLSARDPLWFLVADIASAALWWHPMVWWSRRRLHSEAELAADEATALVPDGPAALAGCLVSMGRELSGAPFLGWVGMRGGFRSNLGRRVERLTRLTVGKRPAASVWMMAAGVCTIPALALLFASAQSAPAQKADDLGEGMLEAWRNSPGGFLMAALNTSVGTPGTSKIAAGKLAYEMGRNEASKLFREVLEQNPTNDTALYFLDLLRERNSLPPANASASGAKDGKTNACYTKVFRVNPEAVNKALDKLVPVAHDTETDRLRRYFSKLGFDFTRPNRSIFFNDRTGLIMVHGDAAELKIVEKGVATFTNQAGATPALQIMVVGKFVEMDDASVNELGENWLKAGHATSTLLTPSERERIMAELHRGKADILAVPKVTTLSGREARIAEKQGEVEQLWLDITPVANADGFTIGIPTEAGVNVRGENWQVKTSRNLYDGDTLVMAKPTTNSSGESMRIVLVTPRLVDPSAHPIHSDEELLRNRNR